MKKQIVFIALWLGPAAYAVKDDGGAWRATMGKLSKALAETVPYLYPDPTLDEKQLTQKVGELYEISKAIDLKSAHAMKSPDGDPALPYISSMFRQEIERAYLSLQDGHAEYGKAVLRSSVSYCIACHTRRGAGAQFPLLKAFEEPLKRAAWIERMEFLAGSRQYDTVLGEVMGKLKSSGTPGVSALDLERGARLALSILVRVKKDPDRAAMLALTLNESPNATFAMKEISRVWSKDIREWQAQRDTSPKTGDALLTQARQLAEAKPGDHAEVRYLRASALLSDFFQKNPSAEQAAEALYLAGRSYDQLGEIGMWNLHEFYYVACIDKAPHTVLAEKCFEAYDEAMTLGYSGSAGIHIPKPVREHLERLKAKAMLKPEAGKL